MITLEDAQTFERCMAVGGFAVFPSDTVYGLACDPDQKETVQRVYLLKRRPLEKPSAVMFFDAGLALDTLAELPPNTARAAHALLPGAVTLLLPNPELRWPLACGADPLTLGLRVPALPDPIAALEAVRWPILQTSANHAGQPDARTLGQVPQGLRDSAELVLDGGELPGTPSTVVDLRAYEESGEFAIAREGAVPAAAVRALLCE